MSKELKVKETELATKFEAPETIDVDANDIIIGKILIGQALSDAVKADAVKVGDIYESSDNTILAKKGQSLDLVVCSMKKFIYVFENKEFKGVESWNPGFQFETISGGVTTNRYQVFSFMVLNVKDIKEKPEQAFPYILNLLKTNYKTGRKIVTNIAKMQNLGHPYTKSIYNLKALEMKQDKYSWFGFDVTVKPEFLTDKEHETVLRWTNSFKHVDKEVTVAEETIPF